MVQCKCVLEAVGGDVPRIPVPADVVDQHVDPRKLLEYLCSKPPHLRLRREVGNEHVHLLTTSCANLASRAHGTLRVTPGDRQVRAHGRETKSGRLADPAGGSGDQHCRAGHRCAVNVFHARGPQAAAGEATTGVVDETVRFEGAGELLNPLAISHTPMNSSHRPPGIVWMRLRLKPITSNTDPPRMTA